MEDLEERWKAFRTAAAARGLRLYPGVPDRLEPAAIWQGDPESFEDFLDLAGDLGVRMIYALVQPFDPDSFLADFEEPVPADLLPELEALREEAQAMAARPARFLAAWIHDGMLHVYVREADWASALHERREALRQRLDAMMEAEEAEAMESLETAARHLAESPEFQQARTYDAQLRIAQRLFPELKRQWGLEDPLRARHRWMELVREARAIYEAEIRPRQERQLAEEADRMMREGMKKTEVARRLGISRERLDRLLARWMAGEEPE